MQLIGDATADYSDVEMRATLEVNLSSFANAIVPMKEVVEAISVFILPRKETIPVFHDGIPS